MDLFRDIKKGKSGNDKALKHEAKHELSELGGEKKAERYEAKVKASKKKVLHSKKHLGSRM